MPCPLCGSDCTREEVDIGVGVVHGPYGCGACGWSEWPEYDCSTGPRTNAEGWHVDQYGGTWRPGPWIFQGKDA